MVGAATVSDTFWFSLRAGLCCCSSLRPEISYVLSGTVWVDFLGATAAAAVAAVLLVGVPAWERRERRFIVWLPGLRTHRRTHWPTLKGAVLLTCRRRLVWAAHGQNQSGEGTGRLHRSWPWQRSAAQQHSTVEATGAEAAASAP